MIASIGRPLTEGVLARPATLFRVAESHKIDRPAKLSELGGLVLSRTVRLKARPSRSPHKKLRRKDYFGQSIEWGLSFLNSHAGQFPAQVEERIVNGCKWRIGGARIGYVVESDQGAIIRHA